MCNAVTPILFKKPIKRSFNGHDGVGIERTRWIAWVDRGLEVLPSPLESFPTGRRRFTLYRMTPWVLGILLLALNQSDVRFDCTSKQRYQGWRPLDLLNRCLIEKPQPDVLKGR